MANVTMGEATVTAAGKLLRCAAYDMTKDGGGAGFSGAVAVMGGQLKFSANAELCKLLEAHVGRPVIIVGEMSFKAAGKLEFVHQVLDQSQKQIWSAQQSPAARAA